MKSTDVAKADVGGDRISRTPTICGGDACIRDTRIPVWSVIQAHRLGTSAEGLRNYFVTPLTPEDVHAALAYYEEHTEEIDSEIRSNQQE
jgi:type III restriction enzyme